MKRPVLTLRFSKRRNYDRLRKVAQLLDTSMNELADAAIEHELDFLGVDLADEFAETVRMLRGWTYTDDDLDHDIEAFAEGEAALRDPIRARQVDLQVDRGVVDIAAVFALPSQ